jgi:FKBP-type peptidyl-prolyl cis-trans isomerase
MRRVVVALMAAALLLSGCSSRTGADASVSQTVGDISVISVGVSKTLAPKVTWPAGLTFSKSQSQVILQGKGAPLTDGQPLLLNVFVESLSTHEVLKNTFDRLPQSYLLAPELLGNDLYNVLLTARVGTRVLSVAPSLGEFAGEPAIVIVIDVLPDVATGEKVPVSPDLPQVTSQSTGEPDIALDPSKTLPVELSISTLIRGDGIQVKKGSYIVAKFKAVYTTDGSKDGKSWKAGDVQQSSWPPQQAPFEGQIGEGKALKAWDEGLIDQTAGSRVMLVVPEASGYPGEGTLVYVIDILAVYNEAL